MQISRIKTKAMAFKLHGINLIPILGRIVKSARQAAFLATYRNRWMGEELPDYIWDKNGMAPMPRMNTEQICIRLIKNIIHKQAQSTIEYSFKAEVLGWLFLYEMILSGDITPEDMK